jgi:hypothetical protein
LLLYRIRSRAYCSLLPALLGSAGPLQAEERWTPTIEVASTLPMDVAERMSLEAPNRLHARASIGVMPGPYTNLVTNAVVRFGGYDEAEADIVRQALGKSLVLRVQGGFRPFERLGFYLDVGYARVSLGGDLAGDEVLVLGRGAIVPQDATSPTRHYEVSSTLHLVVLEIGWQQPLTDWLVVRGALGFAGTQDANSSIKPLYQPGDPQFIQRYCDQAAEYLDRLYKDYVYTPTLTFGAGVRF